jgi:ankyrin repeat protein
MLPYFRTLHSSLGGILSSALQIITTSTTNMSSQTPAVNRSTLDAELVKALILQHRSESSNFDLTENEEILFTACISREFSKIQELLANESFLATAIESKKRPFGGYTLRETSNLYIMLQMAIRAGSAPITSLLLEISKKHNVHLQIFWRTVFAAIDSQNLDVLKELANAFPKSLNDGEDRVGYPLGHAIGRSRRDRNNGGLWDQQKEIDCVKLLLEKGANPNGPGVWKTKPGSHLTAAAKLSPVEVTRLLIQHGAQVQQSGAIQAAAEANRVEILEVLLEHGADVNELLETPMVYISVRDPQKRQQHLSETPLYIAVRAKAYEAAAWLLQNGADKSIQDVHNQSAADLVVLSGDAKMVEIF